MDEHIGGFDGALEDMPASNAEAARPKRTAIPQRIRFEVFKRDKFTCQYCGAKAPDVLLHVDHIDPVAGGGTNDIVNLITACASCNGGKSDIPLSDDSTVVKRQAQLEDLQERRNQLEMMMQWQRDLVDLDQQTVERAVELWSELAPGWTARENGKITLSRLIGRYGLEDVLNAMRVATKKLEFEADGQRVTRDSWLDAFDYIGRVCRIEAASREDPYAKDTAYICGILRRRFDYFDSRIGQQISAAFSWGATFEEIRQAAARATTWSRFRRDLLEIYDEARSSNDSSYKPPGLA